jgi:hypothetical protein
VILAGDPVETGIVPQLGEAWRKHHGCVSDGCRIEWKKCRAVSGYAAVCAARRRIGPRHKSCIRESHARASSTRRWPDRHRNTAGRDDPRT